MKNILSIELRRDLDNTRGFHPIISSSAAFATEEPRRTDGE